ncbi:MAG: hypothetical protein HGA22_15110 [Clostridiales bacterium]|nr:hypothetical protein [Clostridiales bacterium]
MIKSRKGFCMKHFRKLLELSEKYLKAKELAEFNDTIIIMQVKQLEQLKLDVNWFTQKFDYRNNEAPWGNSKDSIPRAIRRLSGNCDLK